MPRDYTHNSPHYDVEMDDSQVHANTMTDQGLLACDLHPIESCSLTPGDPSPLGRTDDGDLVYPEYPGHTFMYLTRRQAAELAHLCAKSHGITEIPQVPLKTGIETLFMSLLEEALPRVFYQDNAHGELIYQGELKALLAGDFDALEPRWTRPE